MTTNSKKSPPSLHHTFTLQAGRSYSADGGSSSEEGQSIESILHVGIDYAGPLDVRRPNGKGGTTEKMYIAGFVCFATKAIHFKLVSDLAGDGGFTVHKGVCTDTYSGNRRNMIGASRQLQGFERVI